MILNNRLIYRVILWFLGVVSIEGLQRKPPKMNSGVLILSLNTSPFDLLLLRYLASPVFVEVAIDSANNQAIFRKSGLGMCQLLAEPFSLSFQEKESGFKGDTLENLVTTAKQQLLGPLVLFFEVFTLFK